MSDEYRLAPFTPATAQALSGRLAEPEVWRPWNWFGFEMSSTTHLQPAGVSGVSADGGQLALLRGDELVGQVQWIPGFWYGGSLRHRGWNIGFLVLPEHRRTRAATAALELLIDYLFLHTTAHRLESTTSAKTDRGARDTRPAGMTREGILREAQWREGEWHDVAVYSILRSEWEAARPSA